MNALDLVENLNKLHDANELNSEVFASLVARTEGVESYNYMEVFFDNGDFVTWERGRGWSLYI